MFVGGVVEYELVPWCQRAWEFYQNRVWGTTLKLKRALVLRYGNCKVSEVLIGHNVLQTREMHLLFDHNSAHGMEYSLPNPIYFWDIVQLGST